MFSENGEITERNIDREGFPVDPIAESRLPKELTGTRCVSVDSILDGLLQPPLLEAAGCGTSYNSGLGMRVSMGEGEPAAFWKLLLRSNIPKATLEGFISSHFETGYVDIGGISEPSIASRALSLLDRVSDPLPEERLLAEAVAMRFVETECADLGYISPHLQAITTYKNQPCGYVMDVVTGAHENIYSDRNAMKTMQELQERGVLLDQEGMGNTMRDENGRFIFLDFTLDTQAANDWKASHNT